MSLTKRLVAFLVVALGMGAPAAQAFVLGPTTPGKWGPPAFGTGATITYSYTPDGTSCAAEGAGCTITSLDTLFNGQGINDAAWTGAVNAAFAAWAAVANVTFVQVPDDGAAFNAATTSGDIRLGAHTFDGAGGVRAHTFFPPANGLTAAGDAHLDTAETWKVGFGGPGFDIFQVLASELGHALGLNDTAVPASLMNTAYSEAFSGPQADDIAGILFIYGPAETSEVPGPAPAVLVALGLVALAVRHRVRSRSRRA